MGGPAGQAAPPPIPDVAPERPGSVGQRFGQLIERVTGPRAVPTLTTTHIVSETVAPIVAETPITVDLSADLAAARAQQPDLQLRQDAATGAHVLSLITDAGKPLEIPVPPPTPEFRNAVAANATPAARAQRGVRITASGQIVGQGGHPTAKRFFV